MCVVEKEGETKCCFHFIFLKSRLLLRDELFFFFSFLILNTISVKECCVCVDTWVICTREEAKLKENNNVCVVCCAVFLGETKIVQMTTSFV